MTFTDFEKKVISDFKKTLNEGKFIDGDVKPAKEVRESSDIPFYRFFNSNPDTQGKPFIAYDIVPVRDGRYADNVPVVFWVTVGVDIVMSNTFGTRNEQVLRNELEQTMAKDPNWQAYFSGEYVDSDNKRKVISYDFRKVFSYGE